MFEGLTSFLKKVVKNNPKLEESSASSKDAAKERLHLVLIQDRANVSADFLDLMKQEIIDVIKKYVDIDEKDIDVRLTNQANDDGTTGAPALIANIPIINIKNETISEKMREQGSQMTIDDLVTANEMQNENIEKNEEVSEVIELAGPQEDKEVDEQPEDDDKAKVEETVEKEEEIEETKEADEQFEKVIEPEDVEEEVEEVDKDIEELEKIEELIEENLDQEKEDEIIELEENDDNQEESQEIEEANQDEDSPENAITHKKNRKKKTSGKRKR